MIMLTLVFGTMWLAAKYLSAALPSGFLYSVLAAIVCMVAALPIGLGVGIIMALSKIGGSAINTGDFLLAGMRNGMLTIVVIPFVVAFYRRKRSTA